MEGSNTLNEVLVTGKKRSKRFLRRKALLEKYNPIVWDIGKYYEIPISGQLKYFNNDLMSFLRFHESVTLIQEINGENYLSVPIKKEALLYIDGRRISSMKLAGLNLAMEDVEHIMLQPIRGNRIYQVFTTDDFKNKATENFKKYVSTLGYDRSKKYYPSTYAFNDQKLRQLPEMDWKPNIRTNETGEAIIMIAKSDGDKKPVFYIQGFSNEGILISEIISLD